MGAAVHGTPQQLPLDGERRAGLADARNVDRGGHAASGRVRVMGAVVLFLICMVSAIILVAVIRRYALAHMMDVPNARSSHLRPTPRGGGVAIVIVFLACTAYLGAVGTLDASLAVALGGAGLITATTGFLDDRGHLNVAIRLLMHFAAAAWLVAGIGGLPRIDLGGGAWAVGLIGGALAVISLVWLLNLYNFMDGIDGIAGSQAVFVSAGGALLLHLDGHSAPAALLLALGAASAGFLVWNWPPARIFMGDAGSGFLGLMLGGFGLISIQSGQTPWPWIILMGVFIVDATVTLLRRAARRVPVYQAHRSHTYQNLSRQWNSHLRVTVAVCLVNVLWLGPWAWVSWSYPGMGWLAALVALTPLVVVALRSGAGVDERSCTSPR